MKNQSSSKRVMLQFLLILGLICVSPGIASADYIHDAIKFYAEVQETVGKIPNCPDAQDLLKAEDYIRHIVNGDVGAAELAVPEGVNVSSFDLFFKALKYYAEENYWDFAWTFGEGFACAWSGTISVDAGKAKSRANGICLFPIEFSVRNQGAVSTGAFRITLTNSAAPDRLMRTISSVKGGGVQEVKELVSLKPGTNLLKLTVDEAGQVTERNESNNVYRLTVIVEGSCSPMPAASGGAGVSPAARKALEGTMPGR